MDLICQHCGQRVYEIEIGAGHVDYSIPEAVTPDNPDGLGCSHSPEGPHQGPHEPQ